MIASQFERTLIVCDEHSFVNYLEGCSAPVSKINQLHAAVVEIVVSNMSNVNYFTLQNWYSGDHGKGGVYNFVTKRGICSGDYSELNWLQVEVGAAITWKYPSCILAGNRSKGSFYSVSLSENGTRVDSGTKRIHIGKETKSVISSKSLVHSNSRSVFRSKVKFAKSASGCLTSSRCDTMMIGKGVTSDALPIFEDNGTSNSIRHEAVTSIVDAEKIFYFACFGITEVECEKTLMNCFVRDIVEMLPEEFYAEVSMLLEMNFDDNA